jgi:hypothetical protein
VEIQKEIERDKSSNKRKRLEVEEDEVRVHWINIFSTHICENFITNPCFDWSNLGLASYFK